MVAQIVLHQMEQVFQAAQAVVQHHKELQIHQEVVAHLDKAMLVVLI